MIVHQISNSRCLNSQSGFVKGIIRRSVCRRRGKTFAPGALSTTAVSVYPSLKHECDVLVIGGGLAGCSAALSAAAHSNVSVVLVEKEKSVGGNSKKASSGMSVASTPAQEVCFAEGFTNDLSDCLRDSSEAHARDTLEAGGGNAELVNLDELSLDTFIFNTSLCLERILPTEKLHTARNQSFSKPINIHH